MWNSSCSCISEGRRFSSLEMASRLTKHQKADSARMPAIHICQSTPASIRLTADYSLGMGGSMALQNAWVAQLSCCLQPDRQEAADGTLGDLCGVPACPAACCGLLAKGRRAPLLWSRALVLLARCCLDGTILMVEHCCVGSIVSQSLRSTSSLEDITPRSHLTTTCSFTFLHRTNFLQEICRAWSNASSTT